MNNSAFDVVIVGGGMVGLTLANALAGHALRIAVIEKHTPQDIHPDDAFDLRVSAINSASRQVFESLGAWSGMQQRRAAAYQGMYVWDATGDGDIQFNAVDQGVAELGHIIENRAIQFALYEVLLQHPQISFFCPAEITSLEYSEHGSQLELASGESLTARLLAGADGANSQVRAAAGIALDSEDYGQQGLVCVATTSKPHQHTAWQRFLPGGPLAFLPLKDEYQCSIVWSMPAAQADEYLALDEAAFNQQLAAAFGHRLGQVVTTSKRAAFPLIRRHAQHYVKPGVVLIGDAAHTIHPLAGQGVNLGILDAACLAETLHQAQRQRRNIASLKVLRRYERWRRGDNTLMMYSMSGFNYLFGSDMTGISLLRNQGLSLVNRLGPVKRHFMNQAMGLSGELPEMARTRGV